MAQHHKPAHVVLSEALNPVGRKLVAADLGYANRSIIDKWCEAPRSDDNPDGSGTRSPLSALHVIIHTLEDAGHLESARLIAAWVAESAGGVFAPNPFALTCAEDEVCKTVDVILRDTGRTIESIRKGFFDQATPHRFSDCERAEAFEAIDQAIIALVTAKLWVDARRIKS